MNFDELIDNQTPGEVKRSLKQRFVARRKEHRLTQVALAEKSGVSLGSLKRFESTGEISLTSLIKLAFALGYESDINQLFSEKHYRSIEDVINDARY